MKTYLNLYEITGWERKVHLTFSVDPYSGQIIVKNMSGKKKKKMNCINRVIGQ